MFGELGLLKRHLKSRGVLKVVEDGLFVIKVIQYNFMVRLRFELVEHMFNHTFFINQEADAVQTVVHFSHELAPLEIF